ncbi:hypothetical protein BGX23_000839 [Mortierella sp. AD031]|nr:hypothetical protein BGX23_000839 [Mortierella sp. AD031]
MQTQMQMNDKDDIDYEVGQEQLDAVDRMLEELDLDEQFDRVPAAFRIVERFEQQQEQQRQLSRLNNSDNSDNDQHTAGSTVSGVNGHHHDNSSSIAQRSANGDQDYTLQSSETEDQDQMDEEEEEGGDSDEEMGEPFGYIPLDQGDFNHSDNDDDNSDDEGESNENGGYDQMLSDNDLEDDDTEQGYDGYLRTRNRDGTVPVPVIPEAVQIELGGDGGEDNTAAAAAELIIPEEDLKTIAMVMSSFSLPAPDWAQSIPEDRWLPRIVQQASSAANAEGATAPVTASVLAATAMATTTTTTTTTAGAAASTSALAATATSLRAQDSTTSIPTPAHLRRPETN